MIRFEHVSKAYASGSVKAVDDLSLSIQGGKLFGFIGPNGAGKTTTIKLLTGILQPDAGEIWLDDYLMAKNPIEAKRLIGFVPDSFEMFPRLTGMDYLRFLADLYQVPAQKRKAHLDEYLDKFDLADAVNGQIRSYSHGMKQKLSVIGSLIHDPDIWVLDEPMTGLDPSSTHILKAEMKRRCALGKTVFFSTHVLDVAERLCDEIGIIQEGRLIIQAPMEELLSDGRAETLEDLFLNLTDKE